jgi:hypothetical protein
LGSRRAESAPTGFALLDDALLGGWPIGALSQFVTKTPGLGFSLMIPLLARCTADDRYAALVSPPFIPYAPALCNAGVVLDRLMWIRPGEAATAPSLARGPRLDPIGEAQPASRNGSRDGSRDALWATEQMLRSGLFAAVALWSPVLHPTIERRLQLAAEAGRSIAWILLPSPCPAHTVSAVRLEIGAEPDGLRIVVQRCRGGHAGARVLAPFISQAA